MCYLAKHKKARTMVSASTRPWLWPRWLPWFDPMAPPQGRPQRCTKQHKARLVLRLKIGCSRCNSNPVAAPSSDSTVQADPDWSIDLNLLLAWSVVLLRITVEIHSNLSHPLSNLLMGQWFMTGWQWIGWEFRHGCWCWNHQLYLSQAAWCGIRIPW